MSDLRIHAALSPRVAVLSSSDVDRVVQMNGIPDLAALLRPFEASATKLSVRTSLLETRVCEQFPLRFDPYSLYNPQVVSGEQQTALARPSSIGRTHEDLLDLVNQLIAVNIKAWDAQVPRPGLDDSVEPFIPDQEKEDLHVPPITTEDQVTPWFAAVQDLVLRQHYISRHDTFGHPVCVLIVVSSASPDPMNDFARLYEIASHPSPFPAHPYLSPDTLKYYVLLHDVRSSGSDLSGSRDMLEQIKKTYGLHCCLLPINSAPEDRETDPELASLWSQLLPPSPTSPRLGSFDNTTAASLANCIDAEDVKRIKGFIRELTAQSVIPFMERYVQHTGEHLANSRKGLTNRLFGASRKLFGVGTALGSGSSKTNGATANASSLPGGYNAQYDFYAYNTIEAQTRRLADFAFTIRDYKLAASMYNLGRKDYAGDKASRYTAAATEMFGLSHLLIMYTSRSAPIDVDSYLAQACQEYSLRSNDTGTSGGGEHRALRATLLYYEAYRAMNYLRPAPAGLLRMSQSSDEVMSPLLLEQAAMACLLQRPKPALRKHALYLVMAAHRYQACGQKLLSLRCYAQAARIYRKKGWTLIENHIEHELGTQAYNEGDSDQAVRHLLRLVRPSTNSSVEQEAFVKALQTAHKYSSRDKSVEQLRLPHPLFNAHQSAIRLVPDVSAAAGALTDQTTWQSLEEQLIEHGLQDRVLQDGSIKKRKRPATSITTQAREVSVGQTFWLDLVVQNPLDVEIVVSQVCPTFAVLSSHCADQEPALLNEQEVEVDQPEHVRLGPREHRRVSVAVKIHAMVSVRVSALTYRLFDSLPCLDAFTKTGSRLNATQEQRRGIVHAPDTTLAVSVHSPRPTLSVHIVDAPSSILCGETKAVSVVLRNEGNRSIDDVRALCDKPASACFQSVETAAARSDVENHLLPSGPESVLPHTSLAPGQEVEARLTLHASNVGTLHLAWLFSFSSDGGETYLSQLVLSTRVLPCVSVNVRCMPCISADCLYELAIEATNTTVQTTVYIDALTIVSPSWSVEQPSRETLKTVSILPMQRWRETVRVLRLTVDQSDWYNHTVTKLQDVLLSKDVERSTAPSASLTRTTVPFATSTSDREAAAFSREARRIWRLQRLANDFPTMTSRDRRDTFTLYEATDLDVILHFHTDDAATGSAAGEVQVYGLQPGPLRNQLRAITHPASAAGSGIRSMYAQTATELASLLTNILHCRLATDEDPVIIHTTASRSSAHDEVTFTLRNLSDFYTVQIAIQLTTEAPSLWLGRMTLRAVLEPGTAQTLTTLRLAQPNLSTTIMLQQLRYTAMIECVDQEKRLMCRFEQRH